MIVVLTTIHVDPDSRDELLDRIATLREHTRSAEDGAIRYYAMSDLQDDTVVRFFEQYEDEAAAEAHTQSQAYRRFVEALPESVTDDIETVQFATENVEVVEFTAEQAVAALE